MCHRITLKIQKAVSAYLKTKQKLPMGLHDDTIAYM